MIVIIKNTTAAIPMDLNKIPQFQLLREVEYDKKGLYLTILVARYNEGINSTTVRIVRYPGRE